MKLASIAVLVIGCASPEAATPDAAPCPGLPEQSCKSFCYLGESTYKCDDNHRCVCEYRRDGAFALVDCTPE